MTIASNEAFFSGPYTGNGVTVLFDYDFKIYATDELVVTRTNADATQDVLVLTTDYTVAGVGDNGGGEITLVSAATLPTGATLTIEPAIAENQTRPFGTQSSLSLEQVELSLDKLTSIGRQLRGDINRVPLMPLGVVSTTIEAPVVGKILIGADGRYVNGPDVSTLDNIATIQADIEADKDAAAASAAAAATFDPALYTLLADTGEAAALDVSDDDDFAVATDELVTRGGIASYIASLSGGSGVLSPSSGTTQLITGIPATATEVVLHVDDLAIGFNGNIITKLGPSTGVVSTGYDTLHNSSADPTVTNATTGPFDLVLFGANVDHTGVAVFRRASPSTNKWSVEGSFIASAISGAAHHRCVGAITLAAALERIEITNSNGYSTGNLSVTWRK